MWIIPTALVVIIILIVILLLRRTSRRFRRLLLKSIMEGIPEITAYNLDYWAVFKIAMSFNGKMMFPDYRRFLEPDPQYCFNVIDCTIYSDGEEYYIQVYLYYREGACKIKIINRTVEIQNMIVESRAKHDAKLK